MYHWVYKSSLLNCEGIAESSFELASVAEDVLICFSPRAV